MKSKILVFGASGFIGSNTIRELIRECHNVIGCDICHPTRCNQYTHERVDITRFREVENIINKFKPDYIYNFAAIIRSEECRLDSLRSNDVNIRGLYNILDACKSQEQLKRLFFPSTVHVYNDTKLILDESLAPHSMQPLHIYPASKLIAEQLIRSYNLLYNIPYTIFRYGIAYGSDGHPDSVTNILIDKVLSGDSVSLFGNNRRAFLHVTDHVRANIMSMKESAKNKTINFEGPENVTMGKLLDVIMSIANKRVSVDIQPARREDYVGCMVSNKFAKECIGWEPKVDLQTGLRMLINSK